jgi:hypothetical protein
MVQGLGWLVDGLRKVAFRYSGAGAPLRIVLHDGLGANAVNMGL